MLRFTYLATLLAACGSSYREPEAVVRDDHFTISEDDGTAITTATLRANDDNVSNIRIVDPPHHGTIDGYSTVTYTPDPGYHGPDRFTYREEFGEATAEVLIDITSDGVPYERSKKIDPSTGLGVAIADVTLDGKPDIISVQKDADSVTILVNTASGAEQYSATPLRFEGGHTPLDLAVADFDGDGKPDVVTASMIDGLVVLRNLTEPGGPVAFDAPLYVPSGQKVVAVVAADLDGDGQPDLASLDTYTSSLDVRINTSAGPGAIGFGARTEFSTPANPIALAAVDADGVGGVDLIVLSHYPSELSLFTNATAAGDVVPSFGARVDRATGSDGTSLFVADLDGDARPEIGVVGADLWIYKNQSPVAAQPSYEAARVLDLTTASGAVAAFDLDGDQATDLVLGGGPFSLLLNRYSPVSGYMFDEHEGVVAAADPHKRLAVQGVYGLHVTDLDGAPPAEIVLMATDGTYVLYGD